MSKSLFERSLQLGAQATSVTRAELRPDRQADSAKIAHLYCGDGLDMLSLVHQIGAATTGLDPDADRLRIAKDRPLSSAGGVYKYFAQGGVGHMAPGPFRPDVAFRCERPDERTSLQAESMDRVLVELGGRPLYNITGLMAEIKRIAKPGAKIIMLRHGRLQVNEFGINDMLAKRLNLWDANWSFRFKHQVRALFKAFALQPVEGQQDLWCEGVLNLHQTWAVIADTPGAHYAVRGGFWPGSGYVLTPLQKAWGPAGRLRHVRRPVLVLTGHAPD